MRFIGRLRLDPGGALQNIQPEFGRINQIVGDMAKGIDRNRKGFYDKGSNL